MVCKKTLRVTGRDISRMRLAACKLACKLDSKNYRFYNDIYNELIELSKTLDWDSAGKLTFTVPGAQLVPFLIFFRKWKEGNCANAKKN